MTTQEQTKTVFRFCLVNLDTRMPLLKEWRLKLTPDDADAADALHKCLAESWFLQSLKDPHNVAEIKRYGSEAAINLRKAPVERASRWLNITLGARLQRVTILVNSVGGYCFLDNTVRILDTVESTELADWPAPDDLDNTEIITISQYPGRQHWYLSSSRERVFIPAQHQTLAAAQAQAAKFVPEANIKVKPRGGRARAADGD